MLYKFKCSDSKVLQILTNCFEKEPNIDSYLAFQSNYSRYDLMKVHLFILQYIKVRGATMFEVKEDEYSGLIVIPLYPLNSFNIDYGSIFIRGDHLKTPSYELINHYNKMYPNNDVSNNEFLTGVKKWCEGKSCRILRGQTKQVRGIKGIGIKL